MRQLLHRSQRGSANWPFIISLLLLLVFVYMWFSQRDDLDAAEQSAATAKAERAEYEQIAREIASYTNDLSQTVGWQTKNPADVLQNASLKEKANTLPGVQQFFFTDLDKLTANLTPDGTIDVQGTPQPGALNTMINSAEIEIQEEMRTASAEGVEATEVNFDELDPGLKDAIRNAQQLLGDVPPPPVPPRDPDDEAAQAEYESKLKAYEAAVKKANEAMQAVTEQKGWNEVKDVIHGPGLFDPTTMKVVKLDMFTEPPDKKVSVEAFMAYPAQIIKNYNAEFAANKTEDQAVIGRMQADVQAKEQTISDLQDQLTSEQNRHSTDVSQLQGEVAQAREIAEQNRRDATTAQNELVRTNEEKTTMESRYKATNEALRERIRLDKEHDELEIRRQDPDGRILTSSPMMQTAVIDIGTNAKVYPGLRFLVTRIGRGGVRDAVGEVEVVRATGPNTAAVAITSLANPRNPILRGDIISNPFFKANAPVYVYIAGELGKYPREVLVGLVKKAGVVVDDKLTGRTDFIVVPNDMAAPAPKPAGGEDAGEEEGPAPTKSEYEQLQSRAREFGARVITERVFYDFLGL